MFKSFIETQFPISKVSKESYKERKAVQSQTLTGLGKWWGRKPLILIRAALLGILMPDTGNYKKDREIFLKILTMDDESLWNRKTKSIALKEIYIYLLPKEREYWLESDLLSSNKQLRLKQGFTSEEKKELQRLVFMRFTYDKKLEYCERPEQIQGPSKKAWNEINTYLGTTACNLHELFNQLGERQFGRVPRVGDSFCGGGSVPFEAARLGCEVIGTDLNPLAAMLTWAAINIVGGGSDIAKRVSSAQQKVFDIVDRQITEWAIEHNELGWRADAYLYCNEVVCPECEWKVPLAPSWLIGPTSRFVAILKPILLLLT